MECPSCKTGPITVYLHYVAGQSCPTCGTLLARDRRLWRHDFGKSADQADQQYNLLVGCFWSVVFVLGFLMLIAALR
ncbi:hypothetical protein ACODT5_03565 [Streptomyces sp. 5.8]|uniref:hypothetical protein n=1 Tax=Streptomyces sp. 5.8 TaxID=3406571 RepID=UPI003BB7C6F6